MAEKIQKILAHWGEASRRQIEKFLIEKRISVNGQIANLGDRAEPNDKIRLDGRLLRPKIDFQTRVLLYHKPEGEICSRDDPEGRPTVYDALPKLHRERWLSIGRLDINSSGLLIFSNDGTLVNVMAHPSAEIEREYAVRVFGTVTPEVQDTLLNGVMLEDGFAKFETLVPAGGTGKNHWYHVTLKEGRNREVRRLWQSQDITVSRLTRIRYGDFLLDRAIKPGRWRELSAEEVKALTTSLGIEAPMVAKTKSKSNARIKLSKPKNAPRNPKRRG